MTLDVNSEAFSANHNEEFVEAVREMHARNPNVSLQRCRYTLDLVLQGDFPFDGTWLSAIHAAELAVQEWDAQPTP
jgi:hypothetical protein